MNNSIELIDNNIETPKCALIMSVPSFKADQIINEERQYDFRKSPIKERSIGRKVYIYSAGIDSIIGYCFIDKCFQGNKMDMYNLANFDSKEMARIDKYFIDRNKCYALQFIDPVEFEKYLSVVNLRQIFGDVTINKYVTNIDIHDPYFIYISLWDKAYSYDGDSKENKEEALSRILRKNY